MVESIIFYSLAAVLLISSLVIVTRTNPIAAALGLVSAFVALAGMYGLLSASFVAVIQILVYAGGIMVLIIFVIMILNLTDETLRPMRASRFLTSVVLLIVLGGAIIPIVFILSAGIHAGGLEASEGFGNITDMSKLIFGKYIFPFEILSLVLLTAVVGALVLSKRKL